MDSLDTAENKKATEEGTDVYFEILTNWGNPKYLGLTEVCVKYVILAITNNPVHVLYTPGAL